MLRAMGLVARSLANVLPGQGGGSSVKVSQAAAGKGQVVMSGCYLVAHH